MESDRMLLPKVSDGEHAGSPEISIVTTVYRSRRFLDEYIRLSEQALAEIGCLHYELVFVNDGSPDDSLEYLIARMAGRSNVVLVNLSRNFGHHQAAHAGLSVSRGALVLLIDCDLEVSPMVLVEFYHKFKTERCDVVYGFQELRKGGILEQASGAVFWKLFNAMSDIPVPANLLTERLMSRRYVHSLLELGDKNLFLAGMMHWTGFHQVGIPVHKTQREGASTYGLLRRLSLMVNAVTSFSSQPLVWLFHFGATITALSFVYAIFLAMRKVLYGEAIELGFTTIVGLLLFSLGIITMCLGVIGIYLAKIYNQIRGRPIVVIQDIYR